MQWKGPPAGRRYGRGPTSIRKGDPGRNAAALLGAPAELTPAATAKEELDEGDVRLELLEAPIASPISNAASTSKPRLQEKAGAGRCCGESRPPASRGQASRRVPSGDTR